MSLLADLLSLWFASPSAYAGLWPPAGNSLQLDPVRQMVRPVANGVGQRGFPNHFVLGIHCQFRVDQDEPEYPPGRRRFLKLSPSMTIWCALCARRSRALCARIGSSKSGIHSSTPRLLVKIVEARR